MPRRRRGCKASANHSDDVEALAVVQVPAEHGHHASTALVCKKVELFASLQLL
jgi:hypothetical protein